MDKYENNHDKYKKILFEHSKEKNDIMKCLKEWKFVMYFERDEYNCYDIEYFDDDNPHCICGKQIYHIYVIKNIITNKYLVNGSECINKIFKNEKLANDVMIYNNFLKVTEKMKKKMNSELIKHKNKIIVLFDKEKEKNDNFIKKLNHETIKFGKYKDEPYSNINKSYLKWYESNKNDDFNNKILNDMVKFFL